LKQKKGEGSSDYYRERERSATKRRGDRCCKAHGKKDRFAARFCGGSSIRKGGRREENGETQGDVLAMLPMPASGRRIPKALRHPLLGGGKGKLGCLLREPEKLTIRIQGEKIRKEKGKKEDHGISCRKKLHSAPRRGDRASPIGEIRKKGMLFFSGEKH